MKNSSKFRLFTLISVFALLSLSLSSCFSGGYGYNNGYFRPNYGYGFSYGYRPQVRVYVAPQRRYYSHNDNYRRNYGNNNRNYRGRNNTYHGGNSRNGRR